MKATDFDDRLASLPALSAAQKQRLGADLTGADPATTVLALSGDGSKSGLAVDMIGAPQLP